jgi:hypothetical protein
LLEKVQVEPDYPVSGRKCTGKWEDMSKGCSC